VYESVERTSRFSDEMNTLFFNLTSTSMDLDPQSPQELTSTDEKVEQIVMNETADVSTTSFTLTNFLTDQSSASASENGESSQSLDTLVEPSSMEPVTEAKRPAGGRPMPSHMKFS
jgi:hypothetical protein